MDGTVMTTPICTTDRGGQLLQHVDLVSVCAAFQASVSGRKPVPQNQSLGHSSMRRGRAALTSSPPGVFEPPLLREYMSVNSCRKD
jgi:hypothetical protein